MNFTPFDPTRHRSIRDLPRDVALAFVVVLALILLASLAPANAETHPADPFAEYARHQALMLDRHPGKVVIEAYTGQVPIVHGGFAVIHGMQTRVVGKRPYRPCWYTAWIKGRGLVGGSCRGND